MVEKRLAPDQVPVVAPPEESIESLLAYARDDSSGTFSTSSSSPVIIPSPSVAFTQTVIGDVQVDISAVAIGNGAVRVRSNLWAVLDGVTFIRVSYIGLDGTVPYGLPVGGVAVFPAVAVGAHTIQAALSTEDPVGAYIKRSGAANTDAPLTIAVRYN